jgi:hypothetical protein
MDLFFGAIDLSRFFHHVKTPLFDGELRHSKVPSSLCACFARCCGHRPQVGRKVGRATCKARVEGSGNKCWDGVQAAKVWG